MIDQNEVADLVVLAAGKGSRMNAGMNKMMIPLNGIPVLYRTLFRCNCCPHIGRIVLVSRADEKAEIESIIDTFGCLPKLQAIVEGGKERSDSMRNGLRYLLDHPGSEIVLSHDGARPFVSDALIRRLIENTRVEGAAIPVLKITETVRLKQDNRPARLIDRDSLFITQTPQGFLTRYIEPAFFPSGQPSEQFTDEASYLEKIGLVVKMVDGEKWNIKLTTSDDLAWAEFILANHHEFQVQ